MIKTERLILRKFTEADVEALLAILSDEVVNRYLPWFPLKTKQEATDFYQQRILPKYEEKGEYFAICLKDDVPIGYVAVSGDENHDLGYGLRKEFWNQGIVTEAVDPVLDYLKAQDWQYVTATHDIHNLASGKVMEKVGMAYQYSYKEQWQPKDILVTFRMYQLNFDGVERVYRGYWEKYPEHFVEEL